jgi:hypothetical protein
VAVLKVQGIYQVIAGKPSVVGKPESWKEGFDDWELKAGDRITVERAELPTRAETHV